MILYNSYRERDNKVLCYCC